MYDEINLKQNHIFITRWNFYDIAFYQKYWLKTVNIFGKNLRQRSLVQPSRRKT